MAPFGFQTFTPENTSLSKVALRSYRISIVIGHSYYCTALWRDLLVLDKFVSEKNDQRKHTSLVIDASVRNRHRHFSVGFLNHENTRLPKLPIYPLTVSKDPRSLA